MQTDKELIEALHYHVQNPSAWEYGFDESISDLIAEAIARLRALATLEAEPVAWTSPETLSAFKKNPWIVGEIWSSQRGSESSVPLYASPPSPTEPSGDAEAAREALRELANVKMDLSLEDWCRISNTILSALSVRGASR